MRSLPDHSRSDVDKTEQIIFTLNCVINGRDRGQVLCLLVQRCDVTKELKNERIK